MVVAIVTHHVPTWLVVGVVGVSGGGRCVPSVALAPRVCCSGPTWCWSPRPAATGSRVPWRRRRHWHQIRSDSDTDTTSLALSINWDACHHGYYWHDTARHGTPDTAADTSDTAARVGAWMGRETCRYGTLTNTTPLTGHFRIHTENTLQGWFTT